MKQTKPVSKLLSNEDYWAIWLGTFFLLAGMVIYLMIGKQSIGAEISETSLLLNNQAAAYPYKTVDWYKSDRQLEKLTGAATPIGKSVSALLSKPKSWKDNPLKAFFSGEKEINEEDRFILETMTEQLAAAENDALQKQEQSERANFENRDLNLAAEEAAKQWNGLSKEIQNFEKKASAKSYNLMPGMLILMIVLGLIFGLGAYFTDGKYSTFIIGFAGVFALGVLSYLLAAQTDMKNMGISYAVWAIVLGLIISNTIGTPAWMKPALKTEFFIKTGLVLLGSEILINKIMAIGLPGIFVAWVVTPTVLIITYWFGQKILKIGSKTLNITVSADMSVCGVSAAIATAAACNAKKEELTLAVGLSMVFTSVMMIALPAFINAVGMPEVLGGAWIGGTIDATGAVVAAGAFLGEKALNVAATIKMIQNILIGVIAFGVAVYWAAKVENTGKAKVGVSEIWRRFPKFIIGFLGASLLFSAIYALQSPEMSNAFIDHGVIGGLTKNLRGWLFCLAFVSIGLSVNFAELKHQFSGGKPLILYVCGQLLNLALTLLTAYIMFYLVFPHITEMI